MNNNENQIIAMMNPFGYPISRREIQSVLEPNDQISEVISRHVCHFFRCERERMSENLLSRYAKACRVMKHISVGKAHNILSAHLIDPIASAKRCYRRFFHHWRSDDRDESALKSLASISSITIKHLELLETNANVKKIKQYLKNSSG